MIDHNSPIPPWRQAMWMNFLTDQFFGGEDMDGLEEDDDEGIDLGTKH